MQEQDVHASQSHSHHLISINPWSTGWDSCRGPTGAQQAEAVDVMQEGDVPHDQGDAPAEAKGKARRAAEDAVDAAGASVGRYWSAQPGHNLQGTNLQATG